MRHIHVLVMILGLAILGCGKGKDEAGGGGGDKAANDYVTKSAQEDVAKLKAAIATPTPGDAKYSCAQMANIDTLEKANKAVADELRQLCTKDLYLAMIKVEVEKAEAARKAKPDEQMLSECYNAMYDYAKDEMSTAKTLDTAKDLIARFEAVCPPKK